MYRRRGSIKPEPAAAPKPATPVVADPPRRSSASASMLKAVASAAKRFAESAEGAAPAAEALENKAKEYARVAGFTVLSAGGVKVAVDVSAAGGVKPYGAALASAAAQWVASKGPSAVLSVASGISAVATPIVNFLATRSGVTMLTLVFLETLKFGAAEVMSRHVEEAKKANMDVEAYTAYVTELQNSIDKMEVDGGRRKRGGAENVDIKDFAAALTDENINRAVDTIMKSTDMPVKSGPVVAEEENPTALAAEMRGGSRRRRPSGPTRRGRRSSSSKRKRYTRRRRV